MCGGCNLVNPFRDWPPRRPVVEVPCPLVYVLWPVLYPVGLLLSHLTGGRAVYAGKFCVSPCCFCLRDPLECAAPRDYNEDSWNDGEWAVSSSCVNCCGYGVA